MVGLGFQLLLVVLGIGALREIAADILTSEDILWAILAGAL
ncbi:hypothetical protein [Sneathiella litorea]|nr:hypothetical protein [Sneathiella litorea]